MTNSLSAQVLEISVLDTALYKQLYEGALAQFEPGMSSANCGELAAALPTMNEYMAKSYSDIARSLGQARAQEQRQVAATLAGFGRPTGGSFTMASPAPTYSWPKLNYADQPATAAYLVNTSKGAVQCRVTSKNYVFCI